MVKYFFDSYAVVEIIGGNSKYKGYSDETFVITIFNLSDIYWFALREYNEKKADEIYYYFKQFVVQISDEILKEAIKFRKKHKKRKFSYADCIGYVFAIKNNILFLTGDKEFQDLPNVDFVKK